MMTMPGPVACAKSAAALALAIVFLCSVGVEMPEDLVIFLLSLTAILLL